MSYTKNDLLSGLNMRIKTAKKLYIFKHILVNLNKTCLSKEYTI